jgi:AraC family transcriptional regulator of adaptative response/methylated-DNA-[protein]-cysteine methyltransferase
MIATLPQPKMYEALARRDESYVGVFFVGVKTTGVFCRPGCPARTPLEANCEFFPSAPAAMQAGYRPCRRCSPLESFGELPSWARTLLDRIEEHPEELITAAEVRRAGVQPATASRFFRSRLGVTLPALARARRVGLALKWIREGRTVGAATARAGFASESGLRKAVSDLFGTTPREAAMTSSPEDPGIVAKWLETPVGPMLACAGDKGLCLLEFVDRRALAAQLETLRKRMRRPVTPGSNAHIERLESELDRYFKTGKAEFTVPLDAPGTDFQQDVWKALRKIPCGETRSYADIARAISKPAAVRAVARANGDNRIAILIPCHRVIGSDGTLTGYGGGLWRKEHLLHLEGARPKSGGLWNE